MSGLNNFLMHPTKTEQLTIQNYNSFADLYAAGMTQDFWLPELKKFTQYLPAAVRTEILEIGSGSGREAEYFANKGYQYLGSDVSTALLKLAQKRNPQLAFKNLTVYELKTLGKKRFAGFWAAASLLHLPKYRIASALKNLHFVTKNNGMGFISLIKGCGQNSYRSRRNPEFIRYFSYYLIPGFSKLLKKHGFVVLETNEKDIDERTTFLNFYVKVKPL